MHAIKYKVKVYDSETSFVHGFYNLIDEIFIPSLKLCVNIFNDNVSVFSMDKPRSAESVTDIYLSGDLISKLEKYNILKSELLDKIKDAFK